MPARAVEVRLALPADDAGMRALLRRSVMDGAIRLAFTREPAYANGDGLAGSHDASVIAVRDGGVLAMGRCSVQPLMRNGAPSLVGYLGELRTDPDMPGAARTLSEGYALLAAAAKEAGAEGFVTSIADDNARARRVLAHGGRLGLPRYTPLAGLVTLLIPVPHAQRNEVATRDEAAGRVDREVVTAYLAERAREGHLGLDWDSPRWESLSHHGVESADLGVVHEQGRVVAAGIVWDQRAFRQTVVMGYRTALAAARPLVNAAARLTGAPRLPSPQSVLAQGTLLSASATSPSAWAALLPRLRARAAARGLGWLAITRDRRDPDVGVLRTLVRAREYHTTLYDVSFKGVEGFRTPWDDRPMRPEAGLL